MLSIEEYDSVNVQYEWRLNGSLLNNNNNELIIDPFVDAVNGDFNLNATNDGGGTLRSTNYTLGG